MFRWRHTDFVVLCQNFPHIQHFNKHNIGTRKVLTFSGLAPKFLKSISNKFFTKHIWFQKLFTQNCFFFFYKTRLYLIFGASHLDMSQKFWIKFIKLSLHIFLFQIFLCDPCIGDAIFVPDMAIHFFYTIPCFLLLFISQMVFEKFISKLYDVWIFYFLKHFWKTVCDIKRNQTPQNSCLKELSNEV